MARPWRIEYPQAVYHVMARGNNRSAIFFEEADYETFLRLTGQMVCRHGLEVFAFCLMKNHYHFFLRTPSGNLSRAMHWLNGSYTSRTNWRLKRTGHLFEGRYKAVLVTREAHWLHLSMYLHLNPVRAQLARDPAEYEWSSYQDYVSARSRFEWLRAGEVLSLYGPTDAERRRRYRRDSLRLAGGDPGLQDQLLNDIVAGSRGEVRRLAQKYPPAGDPRTVSSFQESLRPRVDLKAELSRVAAAFGIEPEEMKQRRRNFPARLAGYYHLVETCGVSVTETAREFGVSPGAVSQGVGRFRGLMARDAELAAVINLGSGL